MVWKRESPASDSLNVSESCCSTRKSKLLETNHRSREDNSRSPGCSPVHSKNTLGKVVSLTDGVRVQHDLLQGRMCYPPLMQINLTRRKRLDTKSQDLCSPKASPCHRSSISFFDHTRYCEQHDLVIKLQLSHERQTLCRKSTLPMCMVVVLLFTRSRASSCQKICVMVLFVLPQ